MEPLARNKKLLYGAGAAGVLLMLFLLSRGGGGGAGGQIEGATMPAGDLTYSGGLGAPSSFADNGGYTSALSDNVTSALYDVSDTQAMLAAAVGGIPEASAAAAAAAVRDQFQVAADSAPGQGGGTGNPTGTNSGDKTLAAAKQAQKRAEDAAKAAQAAAAQANKNKAKAPVKRTTAQMRKDNPAMVERVKARTLAKKKAGKPHGGR